MRNKFLQLRKTEVFLRKNYKTIYQRLNSNIPILFKDEQKEGDFSEREILYKVLFDMKNDLNDLKKVTADLMNGKQPFLKMAKVSFKVFMKI